MQRRLGDRRGRPRFEIVGDLTGTLDTSVEMSLLDAGQGGVLVQSAIPLSLQSVHRVAMSCDGQETSARVQVRHVRRVAGAGEHDHFLIGFEFLSVPRGLEKQIVAWIDRNPRTAAEGT